MRRQGIRSYGSPQQQRRQSSSGEAVGVDLRVALAERWEQPQAPTSAPAPSPPRQAPELDVARHRAELSRSLVADVGRIAERLRPEHPPRVPPPPPAPVPPSAGVALRVRLESGYTIEELPRGALWGLRCLRVPVGILERSPRGLRIYTTAERAACAPAVIFCAASSAAAHIVCGVFCKVISSST